MMVNGNLLALLVGIIVSLLGLVQLLFGIILKLHKDHDDERIKDIKIEVDNLRSRLHEWAPHIGWVDQQRRWEQDRLKEKQ